MQRPIPIADILIVVVKAILIAAAILFLGSFFGVNVPEADGDALAAGVNRN
jgi:hypothetical protein